MWRSYNLGGNSVDRVLCVSVSCVCVYVCACICGKREREQP